MHVDLWYIVYILIFYKWFEIANLPSVLACIYHIYIIIIIGKMHVSSHLARSGILLKQWLYLHDPLIQLNTHNRSIAKFPSIRMLDALDNLAAF